MGRPGVLLEEEAIAGCPGYGRPVSRIDRIARGHGVDAVIVLAALESAVEVALQPTPGLTPWLAAPAVAIAVLTLLARRRFPFAAPVGLFAVCAAAPDADGRLVVLPVFFLLSSTQVAL